MTSSRLLPSRTASFDALPENSPTQQNEQLSNVVAGLNLNASKDGAYLATITGTTHSVGGDGNKSLFLGKELKSFKTGDTIQIDLGNSKISRRGPGQEKVPNQKEDQYSAAKYTWYPEYSAAKNNYERPDWQYIRADTVKGVLNMGTSSEALRERAAPVEMYKPIGDKSVQEFISDQKTYQNKLMENYSKPQILASHRSIGFEHEFVEYAQVDFDSHIVLATSDKHSKLFNLEFKLETDSGKALEVVMPPFVVPNGPDGNPDFDEIRAIHEKIEKVMLEVKKEAIEMQDECQVSGLLNILQKKGLGEGWKIMPKRQEQIAGMDIVRPASSKLVGDNIYTQMNISLSGEESAKLINQIKKRYIDSPGNAEKSSIGVAYKKLERLAERHLNRNTEQDQDLLEESDLEEGEDLKKDEDSEDFEDGEGLAEESIKKNKDIASDLPSHYVHLNKFLANTLSLPSTLLPKTIDLDKKHDLSSIVKELHGIWAKDALPNILVTTDASPQELEELKEFAREKAAPKLFKELNKVRNHLQGIYDPKLAQSVNYKTLARNFERSQFDGEDVLDFLKRESPNEKKYGAIQDDPILEEILQMAESCQNLGDEEQESIKAEIAERIEGAKNENVRVFFDRLEKAIQDGVFAMIEEINSPNVIANANVEFQSETIDQHGIATVRADTHIAQEPTKSKEIKGSIFEFRNGQVIGEILKPKSDEQVAAAKD